MAAARPIRNKKHVQCLLNYFKNLGETLLNLRNNALMALGVYTALRIGDILSLRWEDVYDFKNGRPRESIALTEQKTGKPKVIAVHAELAAALKMYWEYAKPSPDSPVIVNPNTGKALSRFQAHRIIKGAGEAVGIPYPISCHSLRKTFGYHACKKGTPLPVIMDIYNHTSYEVTRRYLGITQDEKDAVYVNINFNN
ncbi:MAG: tyrosine-type recombinase/integrase [Clostridiales bacterium]|jgi:integrase|nr:tyrosine-type recombinase/integrase [Clostridiales bacterium]